MKTHFKDDAFKYADMLLKELAIKHTLNKKDSLELAVKYHQEEDYRKIIENLMYDGYIHYNTTQGVYLLTRRS